MDDMFEDDFEIDNEILSNEQLPKEEPIASSYIECLKKNFGFSNFRSTQWKIISSIIEEKRDNLAVMATGYGKSLCFQFPSVFLKTVTFIVSPLISLMEDQVLSLTVSNIKACFLGSAQSDKSTYDSVLKGDYTLVYLTPEFLTCDLGVSMLKTLECKLSLVAIDEAHCISKWGHDFRSAFRNLAVIRRTVPSVPILALTATATPQVQKDITTSLAMHNTQIHCTGFDRPNLQFHVSKKGSQGVWPDIGGLLRTTNHGSTIIYCQTRKQTEDIALLLNGKGHQCAAYHAGLSMKERKSVHENFVRDKIRIIVATIAFGMGIDKPDVRLVIHYGASKDLESYYQEVGRAGRDGIAARCHMFYSLADFQFYAALRRTSILGANNHLESLEMKIREYINTTECRRWFILEYFEGPKEKPIPKRHCCDNCLQNLVDGRLESKYEGLDENGFYDFSKDAELLLRSIEVFDGKTGLMAPILFLRGSKSKKVAAKYQTLPLFGKGKNKPEDWWKAVANVLEEHAYLQRQDTHFKTNCFRKIQIIMLTQKAEDWLANRPNNTLKLKLPKDMYTYFIVKKQEVSIRPLTEPSTSLKPTSNSTSLKTTDDKAELVKMLMQARNQLASQFDIMPYIVCSNRAIYQMAQLKPMNIEELRDAKLDGFSEIKVVKFGPKFVENILRFKKYLPNTSVGGDNSALQKFLSNHPMEGLKITQTHLATLSLWEAGKNTLQIAELRGIVEGTVCTHISSLIKGGFIPFTDLKKLGVTSKIFDDISSKLQDEDIFNIRLTPLKEQCPPNITWDQLKYVVAYCQLEHHLKVNGGNFSGSLQEKSCIEKVEDSVHISHGLMKSNICESSIKPISQCEDYIDHFPDSDSDVDFTQIDLPCSDSPVKEGQPLKLDESSGDVLDKLNCETLESKPKMYEDINTISSDDTENTDELDKLILAIKQEEIENNSDSFKTMDKHITTRSVLTTEDKKEKKGLKRKSDLVNKITFIDTSDSSEEDTSSNHCSSSSTIASQQPVWLSKKQNPNRKIVKAFKCNDF